ncbi:MAG: precorrin-3B C(17)-methyltransferase, partial [Gammaproteobacteria bacterium]|nr:precorrin-3B C(17)-methyltransferase [Gammaproteobacteria bacterium]
MSKLFVVSTGPGDSQLVAPRAQAAIAASTDLVAYGL